VWLINREAIAGRYRCTPVEVENWPAYEKALALRMLEIDDEAEKRRPKTPPPPPPRRRR
jgi:hypothetical protein